MNQQTHIATFSRFRKLQEIAVVFAVASAVLANTLVVTGRVAMVTIALVTLDTVLHTLTGVESEHISKHREES